MSKVRVTLEENVDLPKKGSEKAGAFDLVANIVNPVVIKAGETIMIPTGVRLDMADAENVHGFVLPRSGLGAKEGLVLGNGTGLIDNDYTGEIKIAAWNRNPAVEKIGMGFGTGKSVTIEPGQRIAQIIFLTAAPVELEAIAPEKVTKTKRGSGGFGSTGS
jgi:dUTP pyrophosphatase